MRHRTYRSILASVLVVSCRGASPSEAPTIAAASDLSAALPEIAAEFARITGDSVTLVFGSSGNLAQQIQNGAPFQVFLSADEGYAARVRAAGKADDDGALYATGHVGLFVPHGSPLRADAGLRDVAAALRDGRLVRFAIANPEHAPYGRAAREVLMHAELWNAIQPKLVLGENAVQAAQFATSGSAQAGIIPLSLARTEAVQKAGTFVQLPAVHQPLRQRAVLLRGAGATARRFHDFLQSPAARAIFQRYGFVLPGDTT